MATVCLVASLGDAMDNRTVASWMFGLWRLRRRVWGAQKCRWYSLVPGFMLIPGSIHQSTEVRVEGQGILRHLLIEKSENSRSPKKCRWYSQHFSMDILVSQHFARGYMNILVSQHFSIGYSQFSGKVIFSPKIFRPKQN